VFTADHPEERHQRPRRSEAAEVVQLGDHADRDQRLDAVETPQPPDRAAVTLLRGDGGQLLIQAAQAILGLLDRLYVVLERDLVRPVLKLEAREPLAVRMAPPAPGEAVVAGPTQQEGVQAMPGPLQIRQRVRSRTASSALVGGCTAVSSSARKSLASLRASRWSVLIRSPGLTGIRAGATTSQTSPSTPSSWRCST
jgi:hypothetical protein